MSLPGSDALSSARLAPRQLARLARREPRAHRGDRLVDDRVRVLGFSSRNSASFSFTVVCDEALDVGVAELRLRLALELRVAQLHGDDRSEPFAHVLALEFSSFFSSFMSRR